MFEHEAETPCEIQRSAEELQGEVSSKEVDLHPLFRSIQELREAAEMINSEMKVRLWRSMLLKF